MLERSRDNSNKASADRRTARIPVLTRGTLQGDFDSYRAHVSTSHRVLHVSESERSLPRPPAFKPKASTGAKKL
jgi:hypothetical protein